MIGILNGVVDDVDNIKVSPLSRAYTFGDAVYEVIPYAEDFIHFNQHIKRLLQSCKSLNIDIDEQILKDDILKLKSSATNTGYVYYQVSKGVDKIRGHIWQGGEPERFGYFVEHDLGPQPPKSLLVYPDPRWKRCDIKTTGLTGNILSLEKSIARGFDDVLYEQDGIITETSASNIFFIQNDLVCTPSLANNILEGVTRMEVFNICYQNDIEVKEGIFSVTDILCSDAVFLTSSISGIRKVSYIDNTQIPTDNSIVDKLQKIYFKNNLNLVV